MVYCTLFDSNYLDKAKVMIDSLRRVDLDMILYILCMDEKAFSILSKENSGDCILISLENFEDSELLKVKSSRSQGEYCWTCTAKLIQYVIINYSEKNCTYIDADMLFYSNPTVLFNEMIYNKCSVQVVPHNFPSTLRGKKLEKESGKNCVQFNTFSNEEDSMALLQKWINDCIDECSLNSAGDQMYISDWGKYSFVNVTSNQGAGVAPWNVSKFVGKKKGKALFVTNRETMKTDKLVFYHFQNVVNTDRYKVIVSPLLSSWKIDKMFVKNIYVDYLLKIEEAKKYYEKNYGFLPIVCQYISDGKKGIRYYLEKLFSNPILFLLSLVTGISRRLCHILRINEATIDVRNIEEDK